MTEPDEALLWARQDYAEAFRRFKPHISEDILNGQWDDDGGVRLPAHGYRAAVLARAARIKELEAALEKVSDLLSDAVQADCENGVRSLNEAAANYLNDFPHTKKALDDIRSLCAWNLWASPGEPDQ